MCPKPKTTLQITATTFPSMPAGSVVEFDPQVAVLWINSGWAVPAVDSSPADSGEEETQEEGAD